jgi:hypothetical protein
MNGQDGQEVSRDFRLVIVLQFAQLSAMIWHAQRV